MPEPDLKRPWVTLSFEEIEFFDRDRKPRSVPWEEKTELVATCHELDAFAVYIEASMLVDGSQVSIHSRFPVQKIPVGTSKRMEYICSRPARENDTPGYSGVVVCIQGHLREVLTRAYEDSKCEEQSKFLVVPFRTSYKDRSGRVVYQSIAKLWFSPGDSAYPYFEPVPDQETLPENVRLITPATSELGRGSSGDESTRTDEGPECNNTNGVGASRRADVDAYIEEVFRRTKKRITRTDIWKSAPYKSRTEFERWERNDLRRPNKTANQRFKRILTEKPHLK